MGVGHVRRLESQITAAHASSAFGLDAQKADCAFRLAEAALGEKTSGCDSHGGDRPVFPEGI